MRNRKLVHWHLSLPILSSATTFEYPLYYFLSEKKTKSSFGDLSIESGLNSPNHAEFVKICILIASHLAKQF